MTDEELGRKINDAACIYSLSQPEKTRRDVAFYEGLVIAARELLAAPALPAVVPEGCVRVRLPVYALSNGSVRCKALQRADGSVDDRAHMTRGRRSIVVADLPKEVTLQIVAVAEPAP